MIWSFYLEKADRIYCTACKQRKRYDECGIAKKHLIQSIVLGLCVLFTLIFARIGAVIANKVSSKTLNRATGVILVLLGVMVIGIGALI